MLFKSLSLLTLAGYVAAQEGNGTSQDLNATLSSQPSLSNLTQFLSLSPGLIDALNGASNITILAPSDEAFAALGNETLGALAADPGLVAAVLQYHVLNGTFPSSQISNESTFIPTLLTNQSYTNVTGGQVVEAVLIGNDTVFYSGLLQNATVTQADVNFTGGVIHVIDNVLTLPENVLDTANAANLTAFRGALNITNSIDAANDATDVTIFAPTNEAFASIYSALANLSTEDIANVLAYHVISGSVEYSTDLTNGSSVQTANGANLTITIDGNGTVFVNAARVVTPNVLVANGVIHIIDNVLNPSATEGPAEGATTGSPGYTGASSATEVPFTSGQPTPTTQVNPTSEGAGPAQTEASSSSSSTGAAMPMRTGAVGAAALFGAGAAMFVGY